MEEKLGLMSLDRCFRIMKQVYRMHEHDQNFPGKTLDRIQEFLADRDEIAADPDTHHEIVREMKLESLLVTENSPYAEVRAVVDVDDDYTMPCFTLRVWVLGIVFSGAGAFVNQLFSIRQPGVYVTSNVAQLLAYPFGRFMSQVLPDKGFHLFGTRHSLNPGPFNKKEHMLITIMATVAFNTPYTGYIVLTQALPVYFNQPYAYDFGYQILGSIGSNFVGYGLAGMCRRFLVFPSFCVWPTALVTIALNKAFHTETNEPVKGPFGRVFTMSRYKFFLIAFVSMFIYWWFPGFIFGALSYFNWLSWIAPNNTAFNNIVGSVNGLGVNPWPTFDFNQLTVYGFTPLVIPTFTIMNQLLGMVISFFMIVGIYWSNTWNTSYLPINSNHIFDNTGARFNVSNVLNDEGHLDSDKYQQYSQPYMAAGNLVCYFWFFAIYAATISYSFLYHRHEIALGFTSLGRAIKRKIGKTADDVDDLAEDVHYRLMKRYPEVPEWWYLIVLCLAAALGMIGVGVYPTYTTPATVIFGIIMALIFIIPVGLIYAVTGIQVTMNVLAEFIGGSFVQGNALAMNYFKMYGYITTAQAVYFSNDLKLAHYTKIPPRHTFVAQMVATVVSTFICTAVMNFQMGFRDVCTSEAAFGLSCPGENTFFTAAVFWGTFGPKKLFSGGGHYKALLVGFPVGFVLPFIMWGLTRTFPRQKWLRQLHPVMICGGGLLWSPYNFSYYWPTVIITYLSWGIVKKRYLAFWAKYNYVLAAAWMAAIAVAAIIIFFGLDIPGIEIDWWGNNVSYEGCEGSACVRLEVPEVGYFGPPPGTFN
ncbi:OPT oligopeptide transporter protein-domain-containing protein [Naematelia encephala]|uniref:OPT oligopeptide transporter protein-domain-containing protein n=1 Tax=Naematelia encephala TaxID=71784 RepID=A0A1Y2AMX8_9TREE|nr:OPT oligopeptide transporter protein-domain-containing protein [Naematelia encephala]